MPRPIQPSQHWRGGNYPGTDPASTTVTSQFPVDYWHEALGNPPLADVVLDRLLYNAYKMLRRGDVLRTRHATVTSAVTATSPNPPRRRYASGGRSIRLKAMAAVHRMGWPGITDIRTRGAPTTTPEACASCRGASVRRTNAVQPTLCKERLPCHANGGESSGPIPVDDPWGAFADDQLGLMDHLGIREFFFMG